MDVEPGHFANQAPQENGENDFDRNIVQIEQYLQGNIPRNDNTFNMLIQIGLQAISTLKKKNAALIQAQNDLNTKGKEIKNLEAQIIAMKALHDKELQGAKDAALGMQYKNGFDIIYNDVDVLRKQRDDLQTQNDAISRFFVSEGENIFQKLTALEKENAELKKQLELRNNVVSKSDLDSALQDGVQRLASSINTPVVDEVKLKELLHDTVRLAYTSKERGDCIQHFRLYFLALQDWIENKMVVRYYNALKEASKNGNELINLVYNLLCYIDDMYKAFPPEHFGYERKDLNAIDNEAKSKQIKDIEYVHYPRLNSYIHLTEQDAALENKYISLIYQSPRTFDSVIDRIVRKTYNPNGNPYTPSIRENNGRLPRPPEPLFLSMNPDNPIQYFDSNTSIQGLPQPYL